MPAKIGKKTLIKRIEKLGFKVVDISDLASKPCMVLCKECDKPFWTVPTHITQRHTKSCGCVSMGRRKGTKEVSGDYFSIIKKNAKSRGLEFDISIDYISKLLKKQNFKCRLSDMDIETSYNRKKKEQTASLDRINNNKGYIKGNVQWVHRDVNWMKQDFKQEYFLEVCRKISEVC